ncbi:MAG: zinc metalloprotease HtpX [Candidatus Lloydbacteria bacterium RIFCSPHIGHO2_02_FULL_51_22]|uniref:Protease HtpX homolog n=2 Tax=Candidatus Lloydiibacteriota TaxID=1817910 RepID=A0A1G2D735_9BACT|nr:MAG: zinc metalloprotease HtpX [Candidatus Lloydbacteria bacterium RIFCSPHIGHO2_02_FULL_51_22]OGZ16827.1 MAG: zinc metalloprotease HtpX [Candidatus Lloydbacteria bacterium RIFCSPLOWO2_12_FULL_51_9]
MATLYTHQDANTRKTWVLMALFFVTVIFLGWAFSIVFGSPAILYVAVAFSILMNIASYWYSDSLVLKMSGALPADEREYRDLHNIVENLSITAGLPKPRVFVIRDSAPNAFATGRDKEHAVVAVTSGMLGILNRTELEGVIAHELSHIGNRDILLSTVVVVLVGFVTILSDMFLRATMWGGLKRDSDDSRAGGAMLLLGIVLSLLAPLAATLVHLAISRKREFLADASGALLTRYPEGLASALEKIHAHAAPVRRVSHATAHLFLSDPYMAQGKSRTSFLTKIFMTHPPLEERVMALRGHTQ